ncbi:MAG: hypothetical protein RBR86_05560 [Pseudobdellovibrionaceae bacterium]|jgi:hypothetical protein|nr:hypothetical protein [Pseudobdellovibrionaceae bacterium]
MTSQHNLTSDLNDPFDLIDMESNVAPILPNNKLDAMVTNALTHAQVSAPAQNRPPTISWTKTGWWSGGLATAACLILLVTIFPKSTIQQLDHNAMQSAQAISVSQIETRSSQDGDEFEISEMMFYDTLNGF